MSTSTEYDYPSPGHDRIKSGYISSNSNSPNGSTWKYLKSHTNSMTLPFDHTHDLDLGVEISRLESEIALSQEWDGWLTWNEKDVSHPFRIDLCDPAGVNTMYRIVTGVTSDVGVPSTYLVQPRLCNKTAKIWHILSCPLYSTYNSGWINSLFFHLHIRALP